MNDLKSYALELGFDDFGVADATLGTPFQKEFELAISEGRHGPLDYLERTRDERADVQKLMPGARSVVVVVKNYYAGDHSDFVSINELSTKAKVSRYAWGGDYHHWFRKRLRKLRTRVLETAGASTRVHIFNDTGPVLERAWAQRAGLGFIGKSSMFIHRKFGTWVFLGGLVTDAAFPPNEPTSKTLCGSCSKCIDSCPTRAILEPGTVDARRCLTTWNVERPFDPAGDVEELSGQGWVVGCDICQEVCPWNKFENVTNEERFHPRLAHVLLDQPPDGDLSGTPLARPGRNGIARSLVRAQVDSKRHNK